MAKKFITADKTKTGEAKLTVVKYLLESIGYKVTWNGCAHETGRQLVIGNKV